MPHWFLDACMFCFLTLVIVGSVLVWFGII